jgi:hypothetical protein
MIQGKIIRITGIENNMPKPMDTATGLKGAA